MQKYKLLIKGGYGLTNFGDDALLYVLSNNLVKYFNKSDVAFACYESTYTKKFTSRFKIIDVSEFKKTPTSLLIYGGGTQFYNFKKAPSKFRKFLSSIKQLILLKNLNKTTNEINYHYLGGLGIGLGPFINDNNQIKENQTKEELKKMSFISVRDTESSNLCKKWGIDNFKQEADICYSMENKYFYQEPENQNIKKVGIIVRDWNHTKEGSDYYTKILNITEKLNKKGIEVTLILFAKGSDKYWDEQKNQFTNILEWDPNNMSMEDFIEKLNYFDSFITARYHGAVFATLLGKPFISIVVEQKLSLISDIYKSCSMKWEYPFEIDDCLLKLNHIDKNYKKFSKQIIKETIKQKELSNLMFDRFINFCKEKKITKDEI